MTKQNIFDISIWRTNIKNKVNLKELEEYGLFISENSKSVNQTNIGGFQSDNLKNTYVLDKLTDTIRDESKKYSKKLNINVVNDLKNIWININEKGHSNSEHIHPNCVLSGVFYAHTLFNEFLISSKSCIIIA